MKKIKKIAIFVVSAIVILIIGSSIGSSGAKTTLDGEKVTASQLEKKISHDKSKLKDLNNELGNAQNTISQAKDAQNQLDDTNSKLSDAKSNLDNVNSQLSDKQKQLDLLTGQIAKAAGSPKTLRAGRWTVGKDIPEGRYTVTPIGEGSNFVTYTTDGSPDVNTILGSSGEPSYTFDCTEGQVIETEAPVKLTPVQ